MAWSRRVMACMRVLLGLNFCCTTELIVSFFSLPQTGFLYFSCFFKTMRREWFGIDRLRLDKYMMLIRKFIAQMFRHLSASEW